MTVTVHVAYQPPDNSNNARVVLAMLLRHNYYV